MTQKKIQQEQVRPSNKQMTMGGKIFVTFLCAFVLLAGLFMLLQMFNGQALACLKDPLGYGTTLAAEKYNSSMYCSCQMDRMFTLDFNESGIQTPERNRQVYTPSNYTVNFNFTQIKIS